METKVYGILCLMVISNVAVQFSFSQDPVCVEFGNISDCSSSSTWAVDAQPLRLTQSFKVRRDRSHFFVTYAITPANSNVTNLCIFQWYRPRYNQTCWRLEGDNCGNCSYNDSTAVANTSFFITDTDVTTIPTVLSYLIPTLDVHTTPLLNISFSECPRSVGVAEAVSCSKEPCGYNCECQFKCPNGFMIDAADSSMTFKCNAAAKWTPNSPTCIPEPTGVDIPATTPPDIGHASADCVPCNQDCGIGVTVPGAMLLLVISFLTVYMMKKPAIDIGERLMVILYAVTVFCGVLWVIAIGLCFALKDSQSSYITGSVLGAAGITGMAVLTVLFFMQIRSSNDKGIQGKAEEMVPMNT